MPASEYFGWQEYFDIYPFTQDREDARFAMLAAVIANVSGKMLKSSMSESVFLPDYLGERKLVVIEKSLEQQAQEFSDFKERLRAISPQSVL